MLAIEIDGNNHTDTYDYDMNRQTKLQDLGVTFIRFHNFDVKMKMVKVLSALKNKIEEIAKNIPRVSPEGKTVPLQRGN